MAREHADSEGCRGETHLLVELVDVVVSLVLSLDEGGVLLDFLGSRHLVECERDERRWVGAHGDDGAQTLVVAVVVVVRGRCW